MVVLGNTLQKVESEDSDLSALFYSSHRIQLVVPKISDFKIGLRDIDEVDNFMSEFEYNIVKNMKPEKRSIHWGTEEIKRLLALNGF